MLDYICMPSWLILYPKTPASSTTGGEKSIPLHPASPFISFMSQNSEELRSIEIANKMAIVVMLQKCFLAQKHDQGLPIYGLILQLAHLLSASLSETVGNDDEGWNPKKSCLDLPSHVCRF